MTQQDRDLTPKDIGDLLNKDAENLAKALLPGGVVAGGYYHIGSVRGDRGDSLKINLGKRKGAWADYSCDRSDPEGTGDMLKLVFLTVGQRSWGETLRWARGWLRIESMDPQALQRHLRRAEAAQQRAEVENAQKIDQSRLKARNLWMHASPILGTPAMRYLEGRGIDFSLIGRIPGSMRFRADVWQADLQRPVPALLTCGLLDGQHIATHCIYLHRRPDGFWDKLPNLIRDGKAVKIAKKIFGQQPQGVHFPVNKGASRKTLLRMPAGEALHTGEGLEDAATYAMLWPDRRVVFAGTLGNIGSMAVPAQCGDFVILAQRDADGSKAQLSFEKQLAAQQLRARQDGSRRRVMCDWPGEGFKDHNDELRNIRMDGGKNGTQG